MEHPSQERTLVIIKPDGIQRALIGEIIRRYERLGLKLVALKLMVPTEEQVEGHYTLDPNWRRVTGEKTIKGYRDRGLTPPSEDPLEITAKILKGLKKYLTAGPVIAMIWQGAHAVELVRKITGGTEPRGAAVGTIRGDFVPDSYVMSDQDDRAVRNLIHGSGSVEEAEMEIPHWFKPEELTDYKVTHEDILYSKELKGILDE
ncbi:nucleoside-diphosphate kinase [Candidatus Kaiserbacteria bacterium]|nr:nucleoside-diphosphate kinase [Candidatus Kaiserbacteria bacterium]